MQNLKTLIIGGGLTGILCALRLSLEPNPNKTVVLVDSNASLGGRFFFSGKNLSAGSVNSGPGFEHYSPTDLEVMKRHFLLYMTEEEKNHFEVFFQNSLSVWQDRLSESPQVYFVKKELTHKKDLIEGNSEFLTKKEAEVLFALCSYKKEEFRIQDEELSTFIDMESSILFSKSTVWTNISKSIQEKLEPVLTSVVGENFLHQSFDFVTKKLTQIFLNPHVPHDSVFLRTSALERFFSDLFLKRGVQIKNLCTLMRVSKENAKILCEVNNQIDFSEKIISCDRIIFSIPPVYLQGILSREYFSSELSRFVGKSEPVSELIYEINDISLYAKKEFMEKLKPFDVCYFPVEKVSAYFSSDGRMIFSMELAYETSLSAPSVRDALTKLKKSAARLLRDEFVQEIRRGSRIRNVKPFDRVILLPVAKNLKDSCSFSFDLKNTKMNLEGAFACGDYFYSLGDTSWKSIIKSVDSVVSLLV